MVIDKKKITLLISFLLILFMIILYIKQHIEIVQKGYQVEELRKVVEQFDNLNNCLKIEKASLASPERIEEIAKQKLGLILSTEKDIFILGK